MQERVYGGCMSTYGVVNCPIKIIDEKIIDKLANIEVHHEEDKRIILLEFVMLYAKLPEECIFEIGYLKKKFKLLHVESDTSATGCYRVKFQYKREENINKRDEWWDSMRSIVR